MSKIWGAILLFSITVALITGNVDVVINSIMNNGKSAVENVITLIAMMCFWNGIFNIFEKTSAINTFSRYFKKIISKLFDKDSLSDKAMQYISLNVTSNIVGVGNASTINGIKAIEELQKDNVSKDTPNDNMTTFLLLNTASLQLIPTSIIALRAMYGSVLPSNIVIPVWIVTSISLIFGIVSIKILNKRM